MTISEADPAIDPDARRCLERYYAELAERFEEGFDVSKSLAADGGDFVQPRGVFLVVRLDDQVVGCGGVTLTSPSVGYIKRMWVDATVRGRGVGRGLLVALEDAARSLGCRTAQLETNRALSEAIGLYRAAGYREVAPFNDEFYAHHWFEKELSLPNS